VTPMRAGVRERSLRRMDEISAYYAAQSGVLAVALFGSNANRSQFDDYSDLDFLVFVESGAKTRLIAEARELEQLGEIAALRVVYDDAVELLFSDGVLCDFGIVTPEQLSTFPHGEGRYLWQRPGWQAVDLSAREPMRKSAQELEEEALFHLYVGLLREQRGEKAAALDEIQNKAAGCMLSILEKNRADVFSPLRRAEAMVSQDTLSRMMPGYGHTLDSAAYVLELLSTSQETLLFRAVRALLQESKAEQAHENRHMIGKDTRL